MNPKMVSPRVLLGAVSAVALSALLMANTGCAPLNAVSTTPSASATAVAENAPATSSGPGTNAVSSSGGAVSGVSGAPVASAGGSAAPRAIVAAQPVAPITPAIPAASTPSSAFRGIIVSGTGVVTAPPDTAIISAGVLTRATTAQEAQTQNNQTMSAVISKVKALGIPAQDIRTAGVNLFPVYSSGSQITGYSATNTIIVTVEKIDQAGTVLDAAVQAGANQSTSIRFTIKDDSALRQQALVAATKDARAKANALASALGLTITGVESVAEQSYSAPVPFEAQAARSVAGAPAAVPVEPGQLSVTAQVQVVFGY